MQAWIVFDLKSKCSPPPSPSFTEPSKPGSRGSPKKAPARRSQRQLDKEMKEEAERIRLENQALMKKEREEQEKQSQQRPDTDDGEDQEQQQQPPQQQQQQQQAGAPKTPAGRSVVTVVKIGLCFYLTACSNICMDFQFQA